MGSTLKIIMSNSGDFQDAETDYGTLTQRQAENIADLAARRAEERMYSTLGRTVVSKVIYIGGAILLALVTYFSGWFHFGPPPGK